MRTAFLLHSIFVAVFNLSVVMAEDLGPIELGEEYPEYAQTGGSRPEESSVLSQVLLWLPNRVLDLLDVLRFDVGVGPATGAVFRITKYGEVGARFIAEGSARVGLFGRDYPFLWERADEYGIGPAFVRSPYRLTGTYEIGVSADLLIAGGSIGVRFDEFLDFVVGIFGQDLLEDDLTS